VNKLASTLLLARRRFASAGARLAAVALCLAALMAHPPRAFAAQASWERQAAEAFEQGRPGQVRELAETHLSESEAEARDWLGRAASLESRHEEAVTHFEAAAKAGRPPHLYARWRAASLRALGRTQEACSVLDQAFGKREAPAGVQYELGACLLEQGRPRKALPHLEAALDSGLRHSGVILRLARAQIESGREDRTLDLLEETLPGIRSPALLLKIGSLLFDRLLYRQAIAPLEKAWRLEPGAYQTGMYLALAHYLLEEYEEARSVLERITAPDRAVENRYLLGSTYARLNMWKQAKQTLLNSVFLAPERAESYLHLAFLYLERGEKQKAIEHFELGAKKIRPGTKVFYTMRTRMGCQGLAPPKASEAADPRRGSFFRSLAEVLYKKQQWVSALEVYRLALEFDPNQPQAYGDIALICYELGTNSVALDFIRRGVELDPQNAELRFYLGSIQEYLGELDEAIAAYKKALELGSKEDEARYRARLGSAQLAAGRIREACRSLIAAVEIEPESADAHNRLGKFYLAQKEYAAAARHLAKAVELDPLLEDAYYSYGLAAMRNGERELGKRLLEGYRRRKAMKQEQSMAEGMSAESPRPARVQP